MNIKIFNGVKTNFKRSLFVIILVSFVVLLPAISFGQNAVTGDPTKGGVTGDPTKGGSAGSSENAKIKNPIKVNNINDFIKTILEGVIKISIPIIALAIIYSGFLFVSARGNTEKLGKAKDALLYTCIGAAILLGSWAIAQIISNTVLAL